MKKLFVPGNNITLKEGDTVKVIMEDHRYPATWRR